LPRHRKNGYKSSVSPRCRFLPPSGQCHGRHGQSSLTQPQDRGLVKTLTYATDQTGHIASACRQKNTPADSLTLVSSHGSGHGKDASLSDSSSPFHPSGFLLCNCAQRRQRNFSSFQASNRFGHIVDEAFECSPDDQNLATNASPVVFWVNTFEKTPISRNPPFSRSIERGRKTGGLVVARS
jgi:hypothetical protein